MSFLRESSIVFSYRIAMVGVVFSTDIILARVFGPVGKGYIAILIITPVILAVLAGAGLDYGLNFVGHRRRSKAFSAYSTAAVLGLLFATVLCALMLVDVAGVRSLVYRGVPETLKPAEFVSLGIVAVEVLFVLTAMLAMTVGRPVVFGEMRLFRRATLLLVVVAAATLYASNLPAAVVIILAGQITAIGGACLFGLRRVRFDWSPPDGLNRLLLQQGIRAYPGRVSERLQTRVDVVLLGVLGSASAVGVYTVATAIAEILFFISSSVSTVLFSREIAANRDLHWRILRLMVLLGIALAVGTGLLGSLLIPLVYGAGFVGSTRLLLFLLPGVICLSLVHVLTPYLVQARLAHAISVGHVLGLGSNVALNVVLIPLIGALGASIASSFSYALTFFIMALWVARTENRSLRDMLMVRRTDLSGSRALVRRAAFLAKRDKAE